MKPNAFPLLLSLIFLLALSPVGHAASDSEESKALKAQRKEALKERQALQKDQNKRNKGAIADFKSHRSDYKAQAKQLVTDLKTAYELKRVSLNAEHQARIAEAEAEFREQWTAMLLKQRDKKETLEVIQEEAKRYAEALFQLRKQSALELHQAELTY
ncbi:MAG: hypothetical protein MI864_23340, partial [Pseudomonadales bacterium]|nr:hypothetical protein [Pseudomonadales bacterium]